MLVEYTSTNVHEFKISQFVDDTCTLMLCKDLMSIKNAIMIIIINAIGVISGLRLNPTKTKTFRKFSLKTALPNGDDLLIMNFRQFQVSEMRISHYPELFKLASLCHGIC